MNKQLEKFPFFHVLLHEFFIVVITVTITVRVFKKVIQIAFDRICFQFYFSFRFRFFSFFCFALNDEIVYYIKYPKRGEKIIINYLFFGNFGITYLSNGVG
jgi:hypothetical protein